MSAGCEHDWYAQAKCSKCGASGPIGLAGLAPVLTPMGNVAVTAENAPFKRLLDAYVDAALRRSGDTFDRRCELEIHVETIRLRAGLAGRVEASPVARPEPCSGQPIADGAGLGNDGVVYPGDPDHCDACAAAAAPRVEASWPAPRVAALESALREAIEGCGLCHGRGTWETSCKLCGDSTFDHYCETETKTCEQCTKALALLAAPRVEASEPAPRQAKEQAVIDAAVAARRAVIKSMLAIDGASDRVAAYSANRDERLDTQKRLEAAVDDLMAGAPAERPGPQEPAR